MIAPLAPSITAWFKMVTWCVKRILTSYKVIFAVMLMIVAPQYARASQGQTLNGCRVIDGDTMRCGQERLRLLGIDAPELPGHCQRGRRCAAGDPFASRVALEKAARGSLTVYRVGADRYGRTLSMVKGARGDLSCWQLRHGHATYRADWDNEGLVAATCPEAAR